MTPAEIKAVMLRLEFRRRHTEACRGKKNNIRLTVSLIPAGTLAAYLYVRKRVQMRCPDGEVIVADVLFVSGSERDVVYDLVSTNKPERYSMPTSGAAWSTPFINS